MPIVKYQSKTASTAHDGPVLPSSYLHGAVERISALGNSQVIATDDTAAAKAANEDKIRGVGLLAMICSWTGKINLLQGTRPTKGFDRYILIG